MHLSLIFLYIFHALVVIVLVIAALKLHTSQPTIWYTSPREGTDYRINRDYNGDNNDFGGYFFVYEKFAKTPVLAILVTRSKGVRAVITREPEKEIRHGGQ